MVEILRDIRLNVHLLFRVFQHQSLVFLKTIKTIFFMIALSNGQLNDTRGYQIKPTNFTCNIISCFRLKGPCSSVRDKKHFCQIYLLWKGVIKEKYLHKTKNKKCTPKLVFYYFSVLIWFPHIWTCNIDIIRSTICLLLSCDSHLLSLCFCKYIHNYFECKKCSKSAVR